MTAEQLLQTIDHIKKKNLIFDFIGVLFYFDTIGIIQQVGWFKFLRYALTIGENPIKRLKKVLFAFLDHISDDTSHKKAEFQHILLSHIMVSWLLGDLSNEQILEKIDEVFQQPRENIFKNKLEASIIYAITQIMFDAKVLVEKIVKPVKKSIKVLQAFHSSRFNNEPRFKLYGLSNMDDALYGALKKKYGDIFELFDGVVISAHAKYLKPEQGAYHYLLDTYKLDPADCLFFDDQQENIQGARLVGIEAILFKRK